MVDLTPAAQITGQAAGSAPELVVLHGLFGQARNWAGIAKRLEDRFRIHALDLRNHGSAPWDDQMDYPAMAKDVAGYIHSQGLEGCCLLGHSMGGKAAMVCALENPGLIGKLVVVDIAPAPKRLTFDRYSEAMLAIDLDQVSRRSEVDQALREAVPQPGIRAFLTQNLDQSKDPDTGAMRLRWRCNLSVIHQAMEAIGDFPEYGPDTTYGGPVLFVSGSESDYIQPEHRPAIGALFPQAKARVVNGAGHWVHSEQPEGFLRAIDRFLQA